MLSENDKKQIESWIEYKETHENKIPFVSDFIKQFEPILWPIDNKKKQEIQQVIDEYIIKKLVSKTSKKNEIQFQYFYESYKDLFWKFRKLNEDKNIIKSSHKDHKKFVELQKKIEKILIGYEEILIKKDWLNQPQWVNKTIKAWQKTIEKFFPLFYY